MSKPQFALLSMHLIYVLPHSKILADYVQRNGVHHKGIGNGANGIHQRRRRHYGRNVGAFQPQEWYELLLEGTDVGLTSSLPKIEVNGSSTIEPSLKDIRLMRQFDHCVTIEARLNFCDKDKPKATFDDPIGVSHKLYDFYHGTDSGDGAKLAALKAPGLKTFFETEFSPTLTQANPAYVLEFLVHPGEAEQPELAFEEAQLVSVLKRPARLHQDYRLEKFPWLVPERIPASVLYQLELQMDGKCGPNSLRAWSNGSFCNGLVWHFPCNKTGQCSGCKYPFSCDKNLIAYRESVRCSLADLVSICVMQTVCNEHVRNSLDELMNHRHHKLLMGERIERLRELERFQRAQPEINLGHSFNGDGLPECVVRSLNAGNQLQLQRLQLAWSQLMADLQRSRFRK